MLNVRMLIIAAVAVGFTSLAQAELTRPSFSRSVLPTEQPGATQDQMSQDLLDGPTENLDLSVPSILSISTNQKTMASQPTVNATVIETYDPETRRLIKSVHPDGTVKEFSALNGKLTKVIYPDTVTYEYDVESGKTLNSSFPNNAKRHYDPDSGLTVKATAPDGTVRTYDLFTGTLLFVDRPKNEEALADSSKLDRTEIKRIYDRSTGNLIKTIYPNGLVQLRDPYNGQITKTIS